MAELNQLAKQCTRCKEVKSLECFGLEKRYNIYKAACKVCLSKEQKQRRLLNPEQTRLDKRDWRHNNPERILLSGAKTRAKQKGLDFNLELSDIIIPNFCPVLGISIIIGGDKLSNNSPTLDRIDSTKGYVKGNIEVISWRANFLKSNATFEEMYLLGKYYEPHIK